ncbi:MFS transporter [Nocardioides sp. NPDC004968]|uniref:MFS transporter n=1 Tax=Nocardioides sp. NPDC004968 TaxID=3155894 RepID=UPI0033B4039D
MSTSATHHKDKSSVSLPRLASASFIGTTIEWYDFFIYGTAAALVFNEVFFPETTPLIGTLLAFMTYGVGFVVRPLGAALFGHFGDRIGRKSTLIVTLLLMGTSTFLIGLLPSHATIGNLAPLALILLRILQGLAVGGEWGGAVLIATEYASPRQKVLYGSFAQLGSPGGLLIATAVFTVLSTSASDDALVEWAWRIPFLASALLIPVGLAIRLKIAETPEFQRTLDQQERSSLPILEVFRRQGRFVLIGTFAFVGVFLTYYMLTTFALTYTTQTLGMSRSVVIPVNILAAVVESVSIVVGVFLARRVTARKVAIYSALGMLLWAAPAFVLMNAATAPALYLAVGVSMVFVGTSYGVLAGEVSGLFDPAVRYSGTSLCYHFAGAIGGGLGPITATWLLGRYESVWPVAGLAAFVAILMAIACFALPKHEAELV